MATALDARDWARTGLRGIGNSLYTPFSGTDGDGIDWDAYRTLVRYCVGELRHPMLWCTPPRCSDCRSATIPIRARRRPNCPRLERLRSSRPTSGSASLNTDCGR